MKRILMTLMTVLMVLFMVPQTVQAAETVTLRVKADKSVANPGDTVNYTVSIGAVNNLGGLEFKVSAPEGLTVVEDSVVIPEGLATTIDSDGDIIKPTSVNGYKWSYSAQSTGYTGTADLVLLTFSCKVNEDAALGEKNVTLAVDTCFDNTVMDEFTTNVVPAKLSVEKPKVAVTGIKFDKSTLSMKDGETAILTVTFIPDNADNKNVTWSSDNTAVVTVANGTVTAVKPGAGLITAISEDGNKKAVCVVTVTCGHAVVKTDAVAATCTKDGNIEYYTCSKCNTKFSDAAATKTVEDIVVKATGHKVVDKWVSDSTAHWKACANCDTKLENANHSLNWVVDKAATEDATGLKHEECACGFKQSEGTEIPKLDHVHTGIKHFDAVAATCMKEGTKEYWTCSSAKCTGKYYGDAACQTELTDITVPKSTENHVKDGVWEMDAEKHVRTCTCGAKVDEGVHVYDNAADANCNACNYKRHYIVTSGANAVFTQNSGSTLTFKVDGEFNLFEALEIDGKEVEEENYTVAEGSTVITLKNDYLKTLAVGSHSMKVAYSDGKIATVTFSVREEQVEDNNDSSDNSSNESTESTPTPTATPAPADTSMKAPKTGDERPVEFWSVMLLVALAGIAAIGVVAYKKERR